MRRTGTLLLDSCTILRVNRRPLASPPFVGGATLATIDHSHPFPWLLRRVGTAPFSSKRFHSRHVLAGHSFAEMKFLERSYLTAVRAETSCISLYFMYLIHSCEFYTDIDSNFMNFSLSFSFSFSFSSPYFSFVTSMRGRLYRGSEES